MTAAQLTAPPPTKMLTRREVADLFRVSDTTVSAWLKQGLLPKPVRVGRQLLFSAIAILKILNPGTGE